MLILWSLRSESHDANRLSINAYEIFLRVMMLISTKPSDTSNFMIFYTLFNGQEQNSQKVFSFIWIPQVRWYFIIKCGDFFMILSQKFWESIMLILAYDSYFEKKTQVILVKKGPKDSQPLWIMILIKKMRVYSHVRNNRGHNKSCNFLLMQLSVLQLVFVKLSRDLQSHCVI